MAYDDSAGARAALARAVALTRVLPDAKLTVIAIDEFPEHVTAFAPAASGGPRRIDLAGQSDGADSGGGTSGGGTSGGGSSGGGSSGGGAAGPQSAAGAAGAAGAPGTAVKRARPAECGRDWLRIATDYARQHGVQVASDLRVGHPAGQILIAARAARADLLVIGHSRHPELHNRVLGSTAEHVARHAFCSVLIAH